MHFLIKIFFRFTSFVFLYEISLCPVSVEVLARIWAA